MPASVSEKSLRFVDLFAGLGGFHVALSKLGHRCVFACEIDEVLREVYTHNFGIRPVGDIRHIEAADVPPHDLLCAGFPCQPFSKAGEQPGFECPSHGDLFDYVVRILGVHRPEYVLLENVPNILRHDGGATMARLRARLRGLGYTVDEERYSPHQFGIPQIRERVYIVGRRGGLGGFSWPRRNAERDTSIFDVLDSDPLDARRLSPAQEAIIEIWQEFLQQFPRTEDFPSFPIWSNEFGATYPFEETTPFALGTRRLLNYRGSHGVRLRDLTPSDRWNALPSYARTEEEQFPDWKIKFIEQNRELYQRHKRWIRSWLPRVKALFPSFQKFEWNCGPEARDVWRNVIQFRASGVRVKRPSTAPSLVAMTTTQIPIVGPLRRYMTPLECARLQSLESLRYIPAAQTRAFKALGNAVNSEVVLTIAQALLSEAGKPTTTELPRVKARGRPSKLRKPN